MVFGQLFSHSEGDQILVRTHSSYSFYSLAPTSGELLMTYLLKSKNNNNKENQSKRNPNQQTN